MTLNELIEELESLRSEMALERACDEDEAGGVEVRVAYQPRYPLESALETITAVEQAPEEVGRGNMRGEDRSYVVYLAEGGDNGYAPSAAWEGGLVARESEDEEEDAAEMRGPSHFDKGESK